VGKAAMKGQDFEKKGEEEDREKKTKSRPVPARGLETAPSTYTP